MSQFFCMLGQIWSGRREHPNRGEGHYIYRHARSCPGENVLWRNTGLRPTHEDDFAAVYDLNGTMLRISTMPTHTAQAHTVLGWEVHDITDTVKSLRSAGVSFVTYDGLEQDELGIWSPPGGSTKVAWFKDPDGNLLSLTQF